MAISYHKERNYITAIIQGKMKEVRSASNMGDHYDTILMLMDDSGSILKTVTVS
jgi:hypothetical protein